MSGALALAGALAPSYAQADALDLMRQFNVISFGNLSTQSDIEGRAVVGGDVTSLATMGNNSSRPPYGTSAFGELTVYGNQNETNTISINQPGGVTILGNNSGGFTLNAGNIAIGGNDTNSNVKLTTPNGSVTVLGSNKSLLSSSGGNQVYVGNGNSGEIDTYGTGNTIGINGNNTGTLKVNDGGSVQIHGNNTGQVNLSGGSLTVSGTTTTPNGGGTVNAGATVNLTAPTVSLPSFTSTFTTPFKQLSTQLAGLTATGSNTISGSTQTLSATAGTSGLAVIDVTSALFAANTNIYIDLPSGTSLVVNVTIPGCLGGSNCALNIGSSVHILDSNSAKASDIASYVLWNFEDATSLTIGAPWEGSILAPNAAFTDQNMAIDGTVVASSYTGNGELHSFAFAGSLSSTSTGSDTPVPEPSTIAVLLSGIGALGWLRFRRSAS